MQRTDSLRKLELALGDVAGDMLLTNPAAMAPYVEDRTGRWPGHALAVARPRNTREVATLVRVAVEVDLAIVPQGGNTGLTGGSAGGPDGPALVLSLQRMRSIRSLSPDTPAVVAEAGCILATVQAEAAKHRLQLPLGLGSEGSATIGGLVSTNAGGIRALRHGVMRAQVLGLEVVLPDGRIWDGLRTTLKNNMGYDVKQLFIGAEGTLGIVTAAALRLTPAWRRTETALVGINDAGVALKVLSGMRRELGDVVVACELMQHWGVELATAAVPGTPMPLASRWPWYVLVEVATSGAGATLREELEQALSALLDAGTIGDAVIAQTEAQRQAIWKLREAIVDGKRKAGMGVNVDVAVPPGRVQEFIERAARDAGDIAPGCRSLAFGHVGDGNIHFSVHSDAVGSPLPTSALADAVHAAALALDGSICAEHGVGRKMRDAVGAAVPPVELELFKTIKRALDPANRCNPGAVIAID